MTWAIRAVILGVTIWAMSGCAARTAYEIDRTVVEDMRDSLLVEYGKQVGRMDVLCAPVTTPTRAITSLEDQCANGRAFLRKLADAYLKVRTALRDAKPVLDATLLREIIPLISVLGPFFVP